LPAEIARLYASFDAGIAAGKLAVLSDAVQSLTGKAPTQLEDFLTAHRDALLVAPAH
jgi:NAD(P)H dehydrogenase (quinone)